MKTINLISFGLKWCAKQMNEEQTTDKAIDKCKNDFPKLLTETMMMFKYCHCNDIYMVRWNDGCISGFCAQVLWDSTHVPYENDLFGIQFHLGKPNM